MLKVDHLDAARPQKLLIAAEALGVVDDDARDLELDDRARAHHAGAERRIERHAAITLAAAGLAQAVHFAMRDRVALLDALVMA